MAKESPKDEGDKSEGGTDEEGEGGREVDERESAKGGSDDAGTRGDGVIEAEEGGTVCRIEIDEEGL